MAHSIAEIVAAVERALPPAMAMPDDPVGVQIMTEPARTARTVGVAYEVTEQVLDRAEEEEVDLLVAFHPLFYPAVRRITNATRVERCAARMIRRDTALWIAHTVFDAHPRGTSHLLAEAVGLNDIVPLEPRTDHSGWGMGAVGTLGRKHSLAELADVVRSACNADAVRISHSTRDDAAREVKRVAVLGGSGMSFYGAAERAGADVYVTADVRYHDFHGANDRIAIIDPGHAETERYVVEGMTTVVAEAVAALVDPPRVVPLDLPTNPVRIVVR